MQVPSANALRVAAAVLCDIRNGTPPAEAVTGASVALGVSPAAVTAAVKVATQYATEAGIELHRDN